ncbi:MAG: radical SAM protein [Candidatus Omnitrophica bacterium]|nr:radical SAM protein [Candidatus Omnitrophota bacterium]
MGTAYRYAKRYIANYVAGFLNKKTPQFLIFFVTSKCNCKCGTCFYWKDLAGRDDLTFEEIRRISGRMGEFRTLLLSGGEPFLRRDLYDICGLFIDNNRVHSITVPTNGIMKDEILAFVDKILKRYRDLLLTISVSIDGFQNTHDRIRGVDGAFYKATGTLKALAELKRSCRNLEVVVNTVITNQNASELPEFMEFVYKNFDIDYQDFEILRGDYRDKALSRPDISEIQDLHRLILKNREKYLSRSKAAPAEKIAVISLLAFVQEAKERFLKGNAPFLTCSAGKNIGVLYANGDISVCELLPPVGNLRNFGYDYWRAWNSAEANKLRDEIKNKRCGCTHVCFIKLTASYYIRSIFYLAKCYARYRYG